MSKIRFFSFFNPKIKKHILKFKPYLGKLVHYLKINISFKTNFVRLKYRTLFKNFEFLFLINKKNFAIKNLINWVSFKRELNVLSNEYI